MVDSRSGIRLRILAVGNPWAMKLGYNHSSWSKTCGIHASHKERVANSEINVANIRHTRSHGE